MTAIAGHPGCFAAFVVASAVVLGVALAVLFATDEAGRQLAALTGRTEITVFVRPDVAPVDVDALREGLTKRPDVLEVRTIAKDAALAALTAEGLPNLPVRANPLPDAFAVRLRMPPGETAASARFAATTTSVAALAGVDSAVYDTRWVVRIDEWSARLVSASESARLAVGLVGAIVLACIAWLAVRAMRAVAAATDAPQARGWVTGALLGFVGALLAAVSAWIAFWASLSRVATMSLPVQPIVDPGSLISTGAMSGLTIAAICLVTVVAALAGATAE